MHRSFPFKNIFEEVQNLNIISAAISNSFSAARGPFLERPGNLTGPESDFDIKVSRKGGRVLTSDEVHFVSLYCIIFKPFETPSKMENKTA